MISEKPEVGETLYILNVGNNAGRYNPQRLAPVEVIKVGRKYFTVGETGKGHLHVQFHLDTWHQKSDFTPGWRLYQSPQDWEDEKEGREISNEIFERFSYSHDWQKLPLPVLRTIKGIIEANTKKL